MMDITNTPEEKEEIELILDEMESEAMLELTEEPVPAGEETDDILLDLTDHDADVTDDDDEILQLEDQPGEELQFEEPEEEPEPVENENIQALITEYKEKMINLDLTEDQEEKDRLSEEISNTLDRIPEEIMEADIVYMLVDATTRFPYVDDDNYMWAFSRKEIAGSLLDKMGDTFFTGEIRNKDFFDAFGTYFFLYGAKGLLMDNGANSCHVEAKKLFDSYEYKQYLNSPIPVTNPDFCLATFKFLEENNRKEDYEGRKEKLDAKKRAFRRQFKRARFLIPMNIEGDYVLDDNGKINPFREENRNAKFNFPGVSNGKEPSGIPVFTDYRNYDMADVPSTNVVVMKAADFMSYGVDFNSLVVNMGWITIPVRAVKGLLEITDD